ncbi:uroporphyrinogen-III synthase [Gilvimarinus chinensis]|uniref:uroporphyrinogen-III synthase n=1 Tax=Gilvimarinus chinensis TaxID=396005 RepID=UPI000366671D|nr:uroporphyrinogen-III synthase [Gilvimarinus chinensis]
MNDWRLLITRPEPMASQWQHWLRGQGYSADVICAMVIEPVSLDDEVQAVKSIILDIDQYQKALFVSRNAAHYASEWLDDYWPQWPVGLECFAVGRGTAEALANVDIPVSALGGDASSMNSEHLLAEPALQNVAGEKVVIFRGRGGRELMTETLRARGALVRHCELYHRTLATSSAQALRQWLEMALPEDLITVHSGESLKNVYQLAQHEGVAERLLRLPVLVPGERVARQAQELGFTQVLQARNAGNVAMLEQIQAYRQTLV